MWNSDALVRGEGVTALRRQFLIDLAWPVSSDLLCDMFGLVSTSPDVRDAEKEASDARMQRLADDEDAVSVLVAASQDAARVLALVEDDDEQVAWLTTFALAVVNLLEQIGRLKIAA